jgi:hypothetical protein
MHRRARAKPWAVFALSPTPKSAAFCGFQAPCSENLMLSGEGFEQTPIDPIGN